MLWRRYTTSPLQVGLRAATRTHLTGALVTSVFGTHDSHKMKRRQAILECAKTLDEIPAAVDNAILYTEHVLAAAIRELDTLPYYDSALLYLSDHGESLGESGLYLHGMPYAIAPREQLQVPMVAWFSEGWRRSTGLDTACVMRRAGSDYSLDYLFHTVLGMNDVATSLYRPERDIFRPCRSTHPKFSSHTRRISSQVERRHDVNRRTSFPWEKMRMSCAGRVSCWGLAYGFILSRDWSLRRSWDSSDHDDNHFDYQE